jgi:hypothetical protein
MQINITRELVLKTVQGLAIQLEHGCGNHGCKIKRPVGMGTNASCHCSPINIAKDLRRLAEAVETINSGNWPNDGAKP